MSLAGRKFELEVLDEFYQEKKAQLITVFGRRRIGKTRLLTYWLKSRNLPGLYWSATQTSTDKLLTSFILTFQHHMLDEIHTYLSDKVRLPTWESVFENAAQHLEKQSKKTVIILDEFNYLLEADETVGTIFEKMWHKRFKHLPVMFIIAGSHLGEMKRRFYLPSEISHEYGTGRIDLKEIRLKDLIEFFPKYSFEERVTTYGILGGVPFYLEQFDKRLSISENIKRKLLSGTNPIQAEPPLILQERLQKPRLYVSILDSIAQGNTTIASITHDLDLDRTTVNKYLTTLIEIGLVRREVPATEHDIVGSRRGCYRIQDAYLSFYFRFIHPYISNINMGDINFIIKRIDEDLDSYIEKTTFRNLCYDWVRTAGTIGKISFHPEVIGGHLSAKEEIDVVAINWRSHHILFGECKWSAKKPLDIEVVSKLQQQSAKVIPQTSKGELFQAHYAFFSRAGFTQEALARIKELRGFAVDLVELERVLKLAGR